VCIQEPSTTIAIMPELAFRRTNPTNIKRAECLTQLIRFLVLKLIHPGLNLRFNMGAIFTVNYFLVEDDIPVDRETLLMTDFVNLKIKST
jgi:hypothetical protein